MERVKSLRLIATGAILAAASFTIGCAAKLPPELRTERRAILKIISQELNHTGRACREAHAQGFVDLSLKPRDPEKAERWRPPPPRSPLGYACQRAQGELRSFRAEVAWTPEAAWHTIPAAFEACRYSGFGRYRDVSASGAATSMRRFGICFRNQLKPAGD